MKPVLVIMAAGMGSRYGGLKQMDPVDGMGHAILHYSIYDAVRAGFEEVIFIIRRENEADFRKVITNRLDGKVKYAFAYQELSDIPEGFSVPEGRTKPWGTAHAVRAARHLIKDRNFAVINADDYYGTNGFKILYDFLEREQTGDKAHFAMAGFYLENTVTENGYVARGVCAADENGFLKEITERTRIEKRPGGIAYTEDGGESWNVLADDTLVSMNFWGFTPVFMEEADRRFEKFLSDNLDNPDVDPLKCEYFLPSVVELLMDEGLADVTVLSTDDKWYGVTYKEDKETVVNALEKLRKEGRYPGWEA